MTIRPLRLLSILLLAVTGLAATTSSAQDTGTVLERYGNLDVERSGATIDAELARKLLRRGNTYSNLQRYDEAIAEYRKAISADPTLAEALRNLANLYYFLERYDETKPLLARFINLQEQSSAALIAAVQTLGQLHRQDGEYDAALDYDLRAIELVPDDDSQVHIMANTYNNAGETDKAIAIYRAAVAAQPDNAFFHRSLGRMLEAEGRLDAALAAYREAMRRNPESDFYANLVDSLERRLDRQ